MFMWRSAPGFSSFTDLVSQPVRGTARGRRIRSPSMTSTTTEIGLRETVLAIAGELSQGHQSHQTIALERPPRADFGDYSTNAALLLAPAAGAAPRELAQHFGEVLAQRLGEQLERFEVAGPGFL